MRHIWRINTVIDKLYMELVIILYGVWHYSSSLNMYNTEKYMYTFNN